MHVIPTSLLSMQPGYLNKIFLRTQITRLYPWKCESREAHRVPIGRLTPYIQLTTSGAKPKRGEGESQHPSNRHRKQKDRSKTSQTRTQPIRYVHSEDPNLAPESLERFLSQWLRETVSCHIPRADWSRVDDTPGSNVADVMISNINVLGTPRNE